MWKCWVMSLAVAMTSIACSDDDDASADDDAGETAAAFEAPVADGCIDDVAPGAHDYMCGELEYHVTVPARCVEEPCGLVLDVHGWIMTGADELAETEVDRLGMEHGYIAVHPTATLGPGRLTAEPEHSWRAGEDDVALHAFLQDAIDVFHVDVDRVHVMGFSQGGAMTWRLLCAYSEMFASVSPGAAGAGYGLPMPGGICEDGDNPAVQVPVLFLHGTADALSPHSTALQQRDQVIDSWEMEQDEVLSEDDAHNWTRYTNADGNVFEFMEHDYASSLDFLLGHCFPGSTTGGILACKDEAAFTWGQAAMDFFIAHPRR